MLSLKEVWRAAKVLEAHLSGSVLRRVVQMDEGRLILEFYRHGTAHLVHLCCRNRFARISVLGRMPKAPQAPLAFAQHLRSRFGRAMFDGITTATDDRRLGIRIRTDSERYLIVLSILGARSNIYLLGQDEVLSYAMRPLAESRRELVFGMPWTDPEGNPKSEGLDRWEQIPDSEFLEAVEATYSSLEKAEEANALARRLELSLNKEADFLERKAVNLLQDLGEAVQAEDYRHKGELLKQALHTIRPGDQSATVTDYETGETVAIPLDVRLSAAENLAAYFKRYQKELRGADALRKQLTNLRDAQEVVAAFQHDLRSLMGAEEPDLEAFQELAREPRVRKILARYRPDRRQKPSPNRPALSAGRELPARLKPKRFRSEQGLEIWVGRSEEGNDYLTTRLAHGNDLFFHLEHFAGSHVILRTGGDSSPPSESVLDACELAVHFSKLKDSRRADVHVAPVKNVRKPKGAKPGLVYVIRGKTIHLRRDQRRLESLLASRVDE